jgi:diaminohydroxyphosphoribosylaminopyrimidine deaminase/5-amino-6-(5-phosphoribosylamino)uracil reductase
MNADQKGQLDEHYMRRALDLAALGRGSVEPNPMVGAVIVKEGRIIGEGYHQKFGGPHAERQALSACSESPRGATIYVNLEPCCHTDKKTPPCVPALIEAGLARVVIGTIDPNPAVAGKGIEQLQAAGLHVDVGIQYLQSKQINAPFFARTLHDRPYVTLKWAQSADGKVAGGGGVRKQISNKASLHIVHELRSRSDAILVGIGTVLADDPILTARGVEKRRPLIRAILDSSLRIPLDSKLVASTSEGKLIVYCTPEAAAEKRGSLVLIDRGIEVVPLPVGRMGKPSPTLMLKDLVARGVTHLLADAGPTLAQSLIDQSLADRVWIIHSPTVVGQKDAPTAAVAPYQEVASIDVAGDRLVELLNPYSDVFFAPHASADLIWVREMLAAR